MLTEIVSQNMTTMGAVRSATLDLIREENGHLLLQIGELTEELQKAKDLIRDAADILSDEEERVDRKVTDALFLLTSIDDNVEDDNDEDDNDEDDNDEDDADPTWKPSDNEDE